MAVTIAQFRASFPEFASTTTYPDAMLTFWLGYADTLLYSADRWGDMRDYGIQLVVAHQVTLAGRSLSSGADRGATPGVTTSKSVGGVSVSYDTSSLTLSDAGYWNMSRYGVQFLQLARMVGTGGFQL